MNSARIQEIRAMLEAWEDGAKNGNPVSGVELILDSPGIVRELVAALEGAEHALTVLQVQLEREIALKGKFIDEAENAERERDAYCNYLTLSGACPPGKGSWCRTTRGDDGAGKTTELCDKFNGECWLEWAAQEAAKEGAK